MKPFTSLHGIVTQSPVFNTVSVIPIFNKTNYINSTGHLVLNTLYMTLAARADEGCVVLLGAGSMSHFNTDYCRISHPCIHTYSTQQHGLCPEDMARYREGDWKQR
jgi:hypothetical protein